MTKKVLVARAIFPEVIDKLRTRFEVRINSSGESWPQDQLIAELQGCQGVFIAGTEKIDAKLLDACPQLQAVCSMAVGFNNIDVEACSARGVVATNAPNVLTETTADLGFALMLAAARRVAEGEHFLRAGLWKHWSYDFFCGAEVHGTTLGIFGMGRIGQAIARRGALGFGMPVIYHNRSRLSPDLEAPIGARWVSKEELLRQADHLVLVLPYSPASHHAIGAAELALMKPSATLTNVARGGIVDDQALAQALTERRIAAAGLDVFEGEPSVHPDLLKVPHVVLTPHIGSSTLGTRMKMAMLAADNLLAVLSGQPALTPLKAAASTAR